MLPETCGQRLKSCDHTLTAKSLTKLFLQNASTFKIAFSRGVFPWEHM